MKVIRINADHLPTLEPTAAAIGFFDGFHTGHRALIDKMQEVARQHDLKTAVITFDPDPWEVFRPHENKDHIISLNDRASLAAGLHVDYMYVLHFDVAFANRSIASFHQILAEMQVKDLVCGFDFTYASKGQGTAKTLLQASAFHTYVIDEVEEAQEKVSSTRIEKLLRAGLVEKAGYLLGYYYSIPGVVVHGYRRGSDLFNMPTANLQPEPGYVMPAKGVYAGYVFDGTAFHPAMMNVGTNPTFHNETISIEAHIFDYDQNLYGRIVRFFFAVRLRPEIRFDSIEALKDQLTKDQRRSLEVLDSSANLLAQTVDLWSYPDSFDILEK